MDGRLGWLIPILVVFTMGFMAIESEAASLLPVPPVLPDPIKPDTAGQRPSQTTPNAGAGAPKKEQGSQLPTTAEPPVPPSDRIESEGFTINDFLVEGSSLLTPEKIQEVLSPYKGPGKKIKDIESARVALEKAYQQLGYPTVLVNLPEQTIDQGTVRFNVVEGRLLKIDVTGNHYYSRYNILGKLPSVQIGELLYEPDFVKQLDMVNANPDLKIAPILKPGSEQGTVDLELKAKERMPLHAKVTGDNKGSFTTPEDRITWEAQYTNLWDRDHILTLQTTQTPTDWGAVQSYGFSYVAPLEWPDHLLVLYASWVKSNSTLAGTALPVGGGGDISIAGNATVAGIRYLFPIFKGGRAVHTLTVGADYKRLERTEATFPADLGTAVVLNPIQYTPASIGYSGTYPDSYGTTTFSTTFLGYVAGTIPGGTKADFEAKQPNTEACLLRCGSTGTFGVVKGSISRFQPLPEGFLFSARIDGQWATQPLIPAEQYFAGGLDTVRGYVTNQALGDNALLWRAELYTPDLPSIPIDRFWQRRRSSEVKATIKFVGFYDYARLWVQQAQPGQADIFRLEGVGGGVRMRVEPINLLFQLDFAQAQQTTPVTKKGDTFTHFMVSLGF
jgi:hemolysin activation/secretion protein